MCTVAYDGTHFSGYQVQPNARTVQSEVEDALLKMHKGRLIRIHASGRTDAGVHARGQVFHFDTPLEIEPERWAHALNTLTPADVKILTASVARDDFHARFDVIGKEYRYFIDNGADQDIFRRLYAAHIPRPLDLILMQTAAEYLEGKHDFSSFCAARSSTQDKVRTIKTINVTENENTFMLTFKGDGFLYQMVRIMVGTLLAVGQGRIGPEVIPDIIAARDRRQASMTAPPHGLFLWDVFYQDCEIKD